MGRDCGDVCSVRESRTITLKVRRRASAGHSRVQRGESGLRRLSVRESGTITLKVRRRASAVDANFIMTRLICTGTLTRSRSLMSPCCKAVKGVSRKHTVNLFFYCLLTEAERTLSRAGIPSVPKILKGSCTETF